MGRLNSSNAYMLSGVSQTPQHRFTTTTIDDTTVYANLPTGGKAGNRTNYSEITEISENTGVDIEVLIILIFVPSEGGSVIAITVTVVDGVYSFGDFSDNLVRGKTYTFTYPEDHPIRFSTTSDGTHGGGAERKHGFSVSENVLTFTVPQTVPDTIYYYSTQGSGMGSSLTVGYDTTQAIPTGYTIRWIDEDEIFTSKIDQDEFTRSLGRITNMFTTRRTGAESEYYDTTMVVALGAFAEMNSAATGGPTSSDYSIIDGQVVYSGWTSDGRLTFRGGTNNNDQLLSFSGPAGNLTDVAITHETLHALGIGSTTAIAGRNFNGVTDMLLDLGNSTDYLWTGANALAAYKTLHYNELASDIEGVPLQAEDASHFYDGSDGGLRSQERVINGKTYRGTWNEMVTATGGTHVTTLSAGVLKDIGLPIDMTRAESCFAPTMSKTWAFDVSIVDGNFRFTPNTSVYTNVYSHTTITDVDNPILRLERLDTIVLNVPSGFTMNVYSNTYSGTPPWDSLTTGTTNGTITISPQLDDRNDWLYNHVLYANHNNSSLYGFIKVFDINGTDGDLNGNGVFDINDPTSTDYNPDAILWQGFTTNCYATTSTTPAHFPLYTTGSISQPWALATTCIYRRRYTGFIENSDSGVVLLSQSDDLATSNIYTSGGDGILALSFHENQEEGNVFVRFRVGTSTAGLQIQSDPVKYNQYMTGIYVDYDGTSDLRMFTYDFYSDTLSQVTLANYTTLGTGWNGVMRNTNFKIGKAHTEALYWNGKVGNVTVTTLRNNQALPVEAEILSMIKTPGTWSETYKHDNSYRPPGQAGDYEVTPTIQTLTLPYTFSVFPRLDGDIIVSQGGENDIAVTLTKPDTFEITIDSSLLDKDIKLSTISRYNNTGSRGFQLSAADAMAIAISNVVTEGVTYTENGDGYVTTITIDGTNENLPDTVYIISTTDSSWRDGPIEFDGSTSVTSTPVNFKVNSYTFGQSSAEATSSGLATKVWILNGTLLQDDAFSVNFVNRIDIGDSTQNLTKTN